MTRSVFAFKSSPVFQFIGPAILSVLGKLVAKRKKPFLPSDRLTSASSVSSCNVNCSSSLSTVLYERAHRESIKKLGPLSGQSGLGNYYHWGRRLRCHPGISGAFANPTSSSSTPAITKYERMWDFLCDPCSHGRELKVVVLFESADRPKTSHEFDFKIRSELEFCITSQIFCDHLSKCMLSS